MTNQVIPAEAVEAAAKMVQALHFAEPWESLSDFMRNERLREAELILEAAAPHTRAKAKAEALIEAAEVAERGEGGGHDSGECDDWGAWLRARAHNLLNNEGEK